MAAWQAQQTTANSASGIWHPVSGIRYPVSGIRYPVSGIRHPVSGIRHPASGIRYPASAVRHPALRPAAALTTRPCLTQPPGMSKNALGRGLGALMANRPAAGSPVAAAAAPAPAPAPIVEARERVQHIRVERIRPCPLQPRKDFTPEALRELADSIRERGIVQPLIVRERGGSFELIAGERRWRAAQLAGLVEVPVIAREADDRTVLELALIENLQRENLNAIEEAQGYAQLIGQFELTQEETALKVGKSRAAVANALRLLRLAPALQASVREGRLSVGHAKVILGLDSAEQQQSLAERVQQEGLSVRQTEKFVARLLAPPAPEPGVAKPAPVGNPHVMALENRLRERFGTKVHLRYQQGRGAVEIRFFTDEDLERILQIAGVVVD